MSETNAPRRLTSRNLIGSIRVVLLVWIFRTIVFQRAREYEGLLGWNIPIARSGYPDKYHEKQKLEQSEFLDRAEVVFTLYNVHLDGDFRPIPPFRLKSDNKDLTEWQQKFDIRANVIA